MVKTVSANLICVAYSVFKLFIVLSFIRLTQTNDDQVIVERSVPKKIGKSKRHLFLTN